MSMNIGFHKAYMAMSILITLFCALLLAVAVCGGDLVSFFFRR